MLSGVTDYLVARLVLPMEELQSIVNISVKDYKSRSTNDEYDEAIHDFVHRENYSNQLVVLTDIAQEDWDMPIDFEVVFDPENPSEKIDTQVLVQHIILERGLPVDYVERGFRHMLLLEFPNGIPQLVRSLIGFKDEEIEVKRSRVGLGIYSN